MPHPLRLTDGNVINIRYIEQISPIYDSVYEVPEPHTKWSYYITMHGSGNIKTCHRQMFDTEAEAKYNRDELILYLGKD